MKFIAKDGEFQSLPFTARDGARALQLAQAIFGPTVHVIRDGVPYADDTRYRKRSARTPRPGRNR